MTQSPVTVTAQNGVAVVTVDSPPVNALSQAVRRGLSDAVDAVEAMDVSAAVLICAGRTFIAGADIREFDGGPYEPILPDVIHKIEMCSKPWTAAIHGTALGGGLEVTLGCHYRVAVPSAKLGLPEVNLGLIPGAGGTQRTPRIIGAAAAVEMATSGVPVSAARARETGLVNEIIEGDLLDGAVAFAAGTAGVEPPRIDRGPAANEPSEEDWAALRAPVAKKARGQLSPLEAFDAVRDAYRLDLDEGMLKERETFIRLKGSDQSRALRHAFFSERAVAKPPVIAGATPREIARVAVVGGGLMGSGIATSLLTAGYGVAMIEMSDEAAEAGRARVAANLASAIKRGRLTEAKRDAQMAALTVGADYAIAADCDLAIEAVFEDMGVKREVFAKLNAAMRPDAILATNTSYLNPNLIFEGLPAPERMIGMHFFSPAHVMKLLEVVQADATSPETIATAFAVGKRMRKVAALSGVCEGFIGNRILAAYRRVCEYMAEDIRAIEPIDQAMRAFGMPMGPFQLMDLTGLQIGYATRRRLDATRDPNQRYASVTADKLAESGQTGQKTGSGFYRYEEGNRTPLPSDFTAAALAEAAKDRPLRQFSPEQIQDRALAVMVNEASHILDEGVAARPLDVDMVKLFGYGFPRWRGGPMMAADLYGVDRLLAVMEQVAADDPGSWIISPLFRRVAEGGEGFAGLNA